MCILNFRIHDRHIRIHVISRRVIARVWCNRQMESKTEMTKIQQSTLWLKGPCILKKPYTYTFSIAGQELNKSSTLLHPQASLIRSLMLKKSVKFDTSQFSYI